ncbi:MAG: hypothetical protein MUE73_05700 [Planctomycetes bacterium]|nr:hypothetical protein [Planctomycetota bacterium]
MRHPNTSPALASKSRRTAAFAVLAGVLLLTSAALAVDVIVFIANSVVAFKSQVDLRIAAIGTPDTKETATELKCLVKASAVLAEAADELASLSAPEGLFETSALKVLAKVGGLIEKSGSGDPGVQLGFQALFNALDEWGEALDDLYGSYLPALSEKEEAKVEKLAQKSNDLYDQAMDHATSGQLGKATKAGAKALSTFAKATALARRYADT